MGAVNPNRLRWGACAWLLTLQFFIVEAVAQSRYEGSYSRTDDVISALGAADSAARQLMNASFVVREHLILGGALLLRPVLARAAQVAGPARGRGRRRAARRRLPDGRERDHPRDRRGAVPGGWRARPIALAYAVRPRSGGARRPAGPAGLVGTAATVFFLTGVTPTSARAAPSGWRPTSSRSAWHSPGAAVAAGPAARGRVRAQPTSGAGARPSRAAERDREGRGPTPRTGPRGPPAGEDARRTPTTGRRPRSLAAAPQRGD